MQNRSAAMVEAILEAAIRILRKDGWAAVTTTRVAERAGVSVGSLYQYFPNRESIAAAIVRQRTRRLLQAVLQADMERTAGRDVALLGLMSAFLEEKRRELDLSLAVRDLLPDIQGRHVILEEIRLVLPQLQDKLEGVLGVRPETGRLAIALAAVEGAVWETLTQHSDTLVAPATAASLARIFRAALDDDG
ncbi:MAG: TetR/AcrR family transcriptional regulator [Enhydrobacter sp.]|nr:MAG: TetR/AcrR family transcriptional regulator [Enhydrobacter sp.]